jgi:hypothetical protein
MSESLIPNPLPQTVPAGTRFDWGGDYGVFVTEGTQRIVGAFSGYQADCERWSATMPHAKPVVPAQPSFVLPWQIDWDSVFFQKRSG